MLQSNEEIISALYSLYLPWVGHLISQELTVNAIRGFYRQIKKESTKPLITVMTEVVIFKFMNISTSSLSLCIYIHNLISHRAVKYLMTF